MEYVITLLLIGFSALFSGLTLGLMGLDVHELKRKAKLGDKNAIKIYPIRKRGNLLLATLLLGNVGVNSALSIFLGTIATGVIAGTVATALIFLFGEIIPQAVISRHALKFGARTTWIVRIFLVILFPLTYPIAWVLDKMLGSEMPTIYSKNELMKFIEEHEDSIESKIDEDEERILKGALTFSDRHVDEVMTPVSVAVMIDQNQKFTPSLIVKLRKTGHSRFPVYDEKLNNIVGLLYIKSLVGRDVIGKEISEVMNSTIYSVSTKSTLDDVLNAFINTRNHMFIAIDEFKNVEGLITVEDILEEIVGREIMDESDKVADLRKTVRTKKSNLKNAI